MNGTPTRKIVAGHDVNAIEPAAPGNPAHAEWAAAGLGAPDLEIVREWRLSRLRAELARRDLVGAVLLDPINIRYATDSTNMQIFCMHNTVRYAFVATDGPVVLFDFPGCDHLSAGLSRIDAVRGAAPMSFFDAGTREREFVQRWARAIGELVQEQGLRNRRVAVDRMPPGGTEALARCGVDALDGYAPTEYARAIKHPEEIKAMRRSIHTAETGMWRMWQVLEPGRTTENELWSWLHQVNIARGGEWIETRLLSSGPRTNPWYQESSDRVIEPGDMVAFDTDLVGPHGVCADISRSWVAGDTPTARQTDLHARALEHVETNARLLRPGLTFHELADRSHRLPEDCRGNRYACVIHGVGLCDEYPAVRYPEDRDTAYDGVLEAGMTLCVEAYVGPVGGREGVKIERQGLLTDAGIEFLDRFPLGLRPDAEPPAPGYERRLNPRGETDHDRHASRYRSERTPRVLRRLHGPLAQPHVAHVPGRDERYPRIAQRHVQQRRHRHRPRWRDVRDGSGRAPVRHRARLPDRPQRVVQLPLIDAPIGGRVTAVHVAIGDAVQPHEALIEIDGATEDASAA